MTWPTSGDYNEAIQNPASAFGDPELRVAQPALTPLGLPLPRSGNFADVYEMRTNGQKWAVKCFTRPVTGLRERYNEISRYLRKTRLPFMVDFQYLEQGIRIRGQWYPVLKMHWVEGLSLNEFVRSSLEQPGWLDALAQIWLRLSSRLRQSRIAHADLQHGNVLLVPGSKASALAVKLIDYDGMLVPSLARRPSGELGHPSYQHPQRLRTGAYCLEVDRFPELVIFCALRALLVGGRPLWDRYDNGDNLLFRQKDLEAPDDSPLLHELSQLPDTQVRQLARAVRDAARQPLVQTACLEDLLPRLKAAAVKTAVGTPSAIPEWTAPAAESPEDVFAAVVGNTPLARRPQVRSHTAIWAAAAAFVVLAGGGVAAIWVASQKNPSPVAGLTAPPNEGQKGVTTGSGSAGSSSAALPPKTTNSDKSGRGNTSVEVTSRRAPKSSGKKTVAKPPVTSDPPISPPPHQVARLPVKLRPKRPGAVSEPSNSLAAQPVRLTIPSRSIQDEILSTIHAQYPDRYADPKPESRKQLARTLFEAAGSQTEEDAKRYVLLDEARKLALDAGDLAIAFAAIDEVAMTYDVDGPALKLSTFDAAVGRPAPHPQSWLPWIQLVVDDLLAAHRYDDALRVLSQAEKVGHLTERAIIGVVTHAEQQHISDLQAAWEKVAPAQAKLKQNPTDPSACERMGRFLCLAEGNWAKGLPLLAQGTGTDAALKDAAQHDLSRPEDGESRLVLARAYETLFHNEKDPLTRLGLAGRAVYWYRAARPKLIAGSRETIEKAIGKLMRSGIAPTEFAGACQRIAVVDKPTRCLAVTPDGLSFWVASDGQPLKVYDIESGRPGRELRHDPRSTVAMLRVNPDGRKLAVLDRGRSLVLWRLEENRSMSMGSANGYRQVGWITADLFVATESPNTIWRGQTATDRLEILPSRIPANTGEIDCVGVSNTGRVAVGTTLGLIQVWAPNLADRLTLMDAYARKRNMLQALAFSANSSQLFAAYADGTIVLYARVGSKHAWRSETIMKKAGKVDQLIASPRGRQFVWTTGDNILHVGVRGKRENLRLEGHLSPIRDVAFLPDGWHVISVDETGVVLRWSLPRE